MSQVILPPTPINREADNIASEYLGIAPPVAGSQPSAAAADHTHRVLASSSEIFGFGRMWTTEWTFDQALPAMWALFPASPLTVPAQWTAEFWVSGTGNKFTSPSDGGILLLGWVLADGDYPYHTTDDMMGLNNPNGGVETSVLWGDNSGSHEIGGSPLGPVGTAQHMFVQMDSSGNMTVGINGTLYGPFSAPSGAVIYTSAFPAVMAYPGDGGSPGGTLSVDEIRFSSVLRYPTSGNTYTVPSDPFDPDSSTLVLWHLDDVPYGQFLASSGNGHNVWVPSSFRTADSTINANNGQFALNDITGQSTGHDVETLEGANSNVGTNSGSGAAQTVESIQGQTGNFLLLDKTGAVISVTTPSGAQEIQVAPTSTMNFRAAWSSTTAYVVGDVVTSGGLTYVCIADSTDNEPPNATYWSAIGVGGPLAYTYEQEITSTSAVTALTYTPTISGLYRISFYFRVVTAATDVTVTVTSTDATGAQTWDVLSLTSEPVGSHQLAAITIGATSGDAIDVIVTAGTADQVYFSSSIEQG
jgi:hypothetical protein